MSPAQVKEASTYFYTCLLNDTILTLTQTRPLLAYQNSFMADPSFFAGLLCTTLHTLFTTLTTLVLSLSTSVPRALSTPDDSLTLALPSFVDVDHQRFSGTTILALMHVCMKLEQHGLTEVTQALTLMLSGNDGSSSSHSQEIAPSGLWIPGMDTELAADIQDEMAKVARVMRKRYCEYYTQQINQLIRKYF